MMVHRALFFACIASLQADALVLKPMGGEVAALSPFCRSMSADDAGDCGCSEVGDLPALPAPWSEVTLLRGSCTKGKSPAMWYGLYVKSDGVAMFTEMGSFDHDASCRRDVAVVDLRFEDLIPGGAPEALLRYRFTERCGKARARRVESMVVVSLDADGMPLATAPFDPKARPDWRKRLVAGH